MTVTIERVVIVYMRYAYCVATSAKRDD